MEAARVWGRPSPQPIQMRLDQLNRRRRAIGMIPLIDVVFILLLFFMLSTSLIRAREIKMDFPTPDAEPSTEQMRIVRLESEDGSFSFEGLRYAASDIEALKRLIAEDRQAAYAIDTAPGVSTQALVTLLDRMKGFGAEHLSLVEGES